MATRIRSGLGKATFLAATVTIMSLGPAVAAEKRSAWSVVCADANNARTCRMVQKRLASKVVKGRRQTVGKVLGLTVRYTGKGRRQPMLVMDLPLGVDLRAGMVLRIDNGKETTARYLRCTKNGCTSRVRLTPQMVVTMRKGLNLQVGFRPFGSAKMMVVNASLMGFSRAFARLR